MSRSRFVTPGLVLLAAALACQGEPDVERSEARRVVVRSTSPVQPPSAIARGHAVGPDAAPEVIVLGEDRPRESAIPRPVRRPEPGPRVIYRTVYIHETEPAPAPEPAKAAPAPEPVEVSTSEPVPLPEPESEIGAGTTPPVATSAPAPAPTVEGPNRVRDAAVGAAIGAGIGAVLGGTDGAVRGGIGGAVGGAVGGTTGAVLGGVLGGGGQSRGRIPRRGGGCFTQPGSGGGTLIDDVDPRPSRPRFTLASD